MFIKQLSHPFGFLTQEISQIESKLLKEDANEEELERKGDHRFFHHEKRLEAKFDVFAQKLANKYQKQEMPWAQVTQAVLSVYLVLTSLSMFLRPDFLSVTACTLGIYATECP